MSVKAEEARRICRPEEIEGDFQLEIPIDMVGQERAKKALDFALSSPNKFHVVVVTDGLQAEIIKKYLEKMVAERKEKGESFDLEDYCYVHNFANSESPRLLIFPVGEGSIFKSMVEQTEERLKKEIPAALSGSGFQKAKRIIYKEIEAEADEEVREFYGKIIEEGLIEKWREKGWVFIQGKDGLSYWFRFIKVGKDNRPLAEEELSPQEKAQYTQTWREISKSEEVKRLEDFYHELQQRINEKLDEEMYKLEEEIYEKAIHSVFQAVIRRYFKHLKAKRFLMDLKDYAKKNRDLFMPPPVQRVEIMTSKGLTQVEIPSEEMIRKQIMESFNGEARTVPFKVNLFVDNRGKESPPIIPETTPTYSGLFGKVEREVILGQLKAETKTDHTMIKPGVFHQANGGFVILDLNDILFTKFPVYLGLVRVLKENKLEIQDYSEETGISYGGKTLTPEPAPLELKVIAIIHPHLYYLLWRHLFDREFMEIFKIKAEFDDDIEYKPENIRAYAAWIKEYTRIKRFLPLDTKAQAKIIEYLLRENENQERFLWDIEKLKALIKESQCYAEEENAESVQEKHVRKALEEKIYRSNLIEEIIQRAIEEGRILIDIEGQRVGQINGLAVYTLDDYEFGKPSRITVNTYKGQEGLINIDKRADLSGKTHTLGVEILKGFFNERYGKDKELNFEGTVVFEQNYAEIEGPSASAAELFALISSLAKEPIKQGIAVTGTVDQKGNIGTIGGVNQKIEGFFKMCKGKGLTGTQGVIIPKTNMKNLMLSEEVIEALPDPDKNKEGKFHIWAIENVDQGIEILTGHPAKEVNKLVNQKLEKWSGKKKKRWLFK